MGYLFAVLGGYLLGCSNMAFYLEKMTKKSIRGGGSGNLGASNTVIRLGWMAGLLVGIHDIGKALLVVYLARWLLPQWEYAAVAAGIACVLGHIFPFYLKFKGGKGFASYVGVIFALDWRIALAIIAMIFVVTLITDYIVAATMAGAAEMVLSTGMHPGALKDAVCSPGGSTIAGVKALEEHAFRGAVMDCVAAAYEKTLDLGKGK